MTDDREPMDVRTAWQRDPATPYRMSPDELARRNRRVETDVRNFSVQMYVASVFNVVMWASFALIFSDTVVRVGAVLALAGWGVAIGEVATHRRSALAAAAMMSDVAAVEYYRAALERERRYHRPAALVRRLVAFTIGPTIFMYGSARRERGGWVVATIVCVIWIAIQSLGIVRARRRERELRRQIEDVAR